MPKISEERKTERREQILEGARRCFAENGYEGATVAKLEHTIGLSRGAIFNYFPSKEDLFIELAVRDSRRMSEIWINEGLEAIVREVVELDPAWLAVYLELFRRTRTDPAYPSTRPTTTAYRSPAAERSPTTQEFVAGWCSSALSDSASGSRAYAAATLRRARRTAASRVVGVGSGGPAMPSRSRKARVTLCCAASVTAVVLVPVVTRIPTSSAPGLGPQLVCQRCWCTE